MNMRRHKKGALQPGVLNTAIMALILLVVLFELYAELVPEAMTAGNAINDTGAPLAGLFDNSGVVFVIIMAALIVLVVKSFLPSGRK